MSENAGVKTTLQLVFVYGRDIFRPVARQYREKSSSDQSFLALVSSTSMSYSVNTHRVRLKTS